MTVKITLPKGWILWKLFYWLSDWLPAKKVNAFGR